MYRRSSFNYVPTLVALIAIVLVLAATYWLGYSTGHSRADQLETIAARYRQRMAVAERTAAAAGDEATYLEEQLDTVKTNYERLKLATTSDATRAAIIETETVR